MNPLKINETTTLENGDVVRCVISYEPACFHCYFKYHVKCHEMPCLKFERPDYENVYFELVKNISLESENIEKKE